MASDGLTNREQTGTFLGPSLEIRSERLYDLVLDIPDVMELRALMPNAAIVMSCLSGTVSVSGW